MGYAEARLYNRPVAAVSEPVDEIGSKPIVPWDVWVRVPPAAWPLAALARELARTGETAGFPRGAPFPNSSALTANGPGRARHVGRGGG